MTIRELFDADEAYLKKNLPCFDPEQHSWRILYGPAPCIPNEYLYEVGYGVCDRSGTLAELAIRWYPLDGGQLAPRLEVFDDAFILLGSPLHISLIESLADLDNFTPLDFISKLMGYGMDFRR